MCSSIFRAYNIPFNPLSEKQWGRYVVVDILDNVLCLSSNETFWCSIGPCMESSGFTRTFKNTRTNNLYIEEIDDYVITEMINMLCNE